MSLIAELNRIIDDAKADYINAKPGEFRTMTCSRGSTGNGTLVKGENMEWMKYMEDIGFGGKINLIYIDPPFFSKSNYMGAVKINSEKVKGIPPIKLYAYQDIWENRMESYLRMLCARFFMMRDLLAEDGCLWVHLDWHIAHYVKVILDEIFGEKNFINEIIWYYKSGGTSKKHFSRKHDTLLFYSKTKNYYFKQQIEKSYNREFKPYRFKGVKEYKDELGWYTMVNMKDVWSIDMVGRTSAERTGYATQKPEALLARIVESCSREKDICADFFGGSGTLAAVCDKMNRRWVSCDLGGLAFAAAGRRLAMSNADFVAMEQSEGDSKGGGSDVEAEISIKPIELSEKKILKVKLISYRLDIKSAALPEEAVGIVKKVMESDPLSLIDYWSIDFDFNGEVHKPDMIFSSGKEDDYECVKIRSEFKTISINVVDVFGNSAFVLYEGMVI